MRLLDCARCLTKLRPRRGRGCETTDPLVTTKRPASDGGQHRRRRRRRRAESPRRRSGGVRLLSAVRGLARRRSCPETATRSRKPPPPVGPGRVGIPWRKREDGAGAEEPWKGDDTGRRAAEQLEREYYEHLEALKLLIDPPPCFRNTETRQNFENKLNSLDLRRINTVAIPSVAPNAVTWNRYLWSWSSIREPPPPPLPRRIRAPSIDPFDATPILRSRLQGVPKTVRFRDEVERKDDVRGRLGEGGREGDAPRHRAPGESSIAFDVEVRSGR